MKRGSERMLEEDWDAASFYKVIHGSELSSEKMRRIPEEFLRSLSNNDFAYRVVLKVAWGNSWTIPLTKNKGNFFMKKCGWEEFLRDNGMGNDEFVVFTHQERMHLNVKIFSKNGMKILKPQEPVTPSQSTPRGPKRKRVSKDVKKEEPESEISDVIKRRGGRKPKQAEMQENKIMQRRRIVRRATESSPSSEFPRFTIKIKPTYLNFLLVPSWFAMEHLPRKSTRIVIRDSTGKTWEMTCLYRQGRMTLSAGWVGFAREIGLKEGDWCTLELFNDNEMHIQVSKGRPT
ncbi:PREDICTED: B3 domain-containing protein At5g18090-like [Tarenaya hassleriana]|uniref:B3 domain-containing protein At5g18090-like n=1 Tax=Tarenaya hassleriana TaxID=28532 RepID=UPI00053C9914|nr:PREDICTED: B3 domain-containing protein At5g18090-like [Tarenaya hassleriana]